MSNINKRILKKRNKAKNICPRCEGLIPSNEHWGEYMGAISRLTREPGKPTLEVCSACGTEEAMQEFEFGSATPESEFPVMTEWAIQRRGEALLILLEMRKTLLEMGDDTPEQTF